MNGVAITVVGYAAETKLAHAAKDVFLWMSGQERHRTSHKRHRGTREKHQEITKKPYFHKFFVIILGYLLCVQYGENLFH